MSNSVVLPEKGQASLTLIWTIHLPLINLALCCPRNPNSPTNPRQQSPRSIYVDFCNGASGRTPVIEQDLNKRLQPSQTNGYTNRIYYSTTNGTQPRPTKPRHSALWISVPTMKSGRSRLETATTCTTSPTMPTSPTHPDLLSSIYAKQEHKKVFRLFNLAFQRYDNPLAVRILRNNVATADGFGIVVVQARIIFSLVTVMLVWPPLLLIPFAFLELPGPPVFNICYACDSVLPVSDGLVSSLRTRSMVEI